MKDWWKLDNAAKLYPSVTNKKNSSVFRVAAVMKEKVNPIILQQAADTIFERFPIFMVQMRNGVFWNYLEKITEQFYIEEETEYPCKLSNSFDGSGYLIRILYANNRIAIEIFHALTDGSGAVELLKSLLYYYLLFSGKNISSKNAILKVEDGVDPLELEDSFMHYYKESNYETTKSKRAYHIKGAPYIGAGNNVIHGSMSVSDLKKCANAEGISISAYLIGTLIYAIYLSKMVLIDSKAPIVVAVPVNLRKKFPSKTLRNFYGVVNVGMIVSKDQTVQDIRLQIGEILAHKTSKINLETVIQQNVKLERVFLTRLVPLFLKNFAVDWGFKTLGESKKSISFSNMGMIHLPEDMLDYIEHIEVVLYPTKDSPMNCGIASFDDKLNISFVKTVMDTEIMRTFFSLISQELDTPVEVYENEWRGYDEK